jgi:hypothetical protein
LDGDREGPGQDAVVPEHGRRGVALVEQGRVELVEVLRTQPVEAVAADARD